MNSREFASMLGVSQSTVSRALNSSPRVPAEVGERIRRAALEAGFELNSSARSLRTNRTGTVGVLFPRHFRSMSENLMLAHIFDHIQNELIANDYDVMTVYDYGPERRESVLERMIRRRKLDGLILFRRTLSENENALIEKRGFPCVFMLNNDTAMRGVSRFFSDNEHGGFLAGDFFGRFAEHAPVHIGALEDGDKTDEQLAGFRRGLAAHGRALPGGAAMRCRLSTGAAYGFVMDNRDFFANAALSIFPHTDSIALGVLAALRDLGAAVPEQAQIIGADDVPVTEWIRPRLSAVHIPVPEMVRAGCAHLRKLIEGEKREIVAERFAPGLVLRDTTLPARVVDSPPPGNYPCCRRRGGACVNINTR